MIPKGHLFFCPHCKKPLYKVMADVRISESVNETIGRFIAIFPQPLLTNSSLVVQECHYCSHKFSFLDLIKTYWRK